MDPRPLPRPHLHLGGKAVAASPPPLALLFSPIAIFLAF